MVLVSVDRHVRVYGLVVCKNNAYLLIIPTPILVNMQRLPCARILFVRDIGIIYVGEFCTKQDSVGGFVRAGDSPGLPKVMLCRF